MKDKQQLSKIPIADLKLDSYNPRMPKSKQGKDEKSVIEYMLLEASTLELMLAIGENDFFAGELLLVVPDVQEQGKYVVVEGNRRLTAVKLLNNPELATVKKLSIKEIVEEAKFKPTELPCLIFETKNDILKYLGFRHITGIKSWRLLEKARYLYEFRNTDDFKDLPFTNASREIAKIIGSSSAYVKRLLISFELYKIVEDDAFYQIDGLNDTRFFLNYFTDGLNKENIRKFLNIDVYSETPIGQLNRKNLKKIVHWWFEKSEGLSRVSGEEGLRLLDAVIGNVVALAAFEKGATLYQSYDLINDIDLQFEKKIKNSLKAMEQANKLLNRVKFFYSELDDDLENISRIVAKNNNLKLKIEQNGNGF